MKQLTPEQQWYQDKLDRKKRRSAMWKKTKEWTINICLVGTLSIIVTTFVVLTIKGIHLYLREKEEVRMRDIALKLIKEHQFFIIKSYDMPVNYTNILYK